MKTKSKITSGGVILAEDTKGNRFRIIITVEDEFLLSKRTAPRTREKIRSNPSYKLEDGRRVERIDDDTFKIVRTGEILKRVEE